MLLRYCRLIILPLFESTSIRAMFNIFSFPVNEELGFSMISTCHLYPCSSSEIHLLKNISGFCSGIEKFVLIKKQVSESSRAILKAFEEVMGSILLSLIAFLSSIDCLKIKIEIIFFPSTT
jgi:hypothetical protein